MKLSPIEGAGNAGRPMHPQPRMQNKKAHEHSHHGHTGFTRHSPRNGFTAYFVLSPATNSSCHRRPRIKVLSARLGRLASANLTPATGARTTRLHRTQHPFSAKGFDGQAPFVCVPFVSSRALST